MRQTSSQSAKPKPKLKPLLKALRQQTKAGCVEAAADILNEALERFPGNRRLLRRAAGLARRQRGSLLAMGRGPDAQRWLQLALQRMPADPPLLRTARDLWRRLGDPPAALGFASRLAGGPCPTAHDACQQVELLILAGRLRQSQRCLGAALRRFPRDKELLTLASDLCRLRGRRRASLRYARLLADNYPLSWRGYARGVEELLLLQRPAEARQLLEKARQQMAQPELASRRTAGMRLPVSERFLANPRTRCLLQAWQACQVWHDPFGCHLPLPMQVPGVPAAARPRFGKTQFAKPQPIQYWSQGCPPGDVQAITHAWNELLAEQGLDPIQCFDGVSARLWIISHAPDYLLPFDTAFHFAVEADVFRLAYASQTDCLYLDADLAPGPPSGPALNVLLSTGCSALFIRTQRPTLSNCFFLARQGCPFFGLVARSGVRLDFRRMRRDANTVMNTFGPDKYNYCLRHLFSTNPHPVQLRRLAPGVVQLQTGRCSLVLANDQVISSLKPPDLAYKQTDQHWIRAFG